jgi:hypothetical protein
LPDKPGSAGILPAKIAQRSKYVSCDLAALAGKMPALPGLEPFLTLRAAVIIIKVKSKNHPGVAHTK